MRKKFLITALCFIGLLTASPVYAENQAAEAQTVESAEAVSTAAEESAAASTKEETTPSETAQSLASLRLSFVNEEGIPVSHVGVSLYKVASVVITNDPDLLDENYKRLYHQADKDVENDQDAPNYKDAARQFPVILSRLVDTHDTIRADIHTESDVHGVVEIAFPQTEKDPMQPDTSNEATYLVKEEASSENAVLYDSFEPFLISVPGRIGDRVTNVMDYTITLYTPERHILTDQNPKETETTETISGGKALNVTPRQSTVTAEKEETKEETPQRQETKVVAVLPIVLFFILLTAAAAAGGGFYLYKIHKKHQEEDQTENW